MEGHPETTGCLGLGQVSGNIKGCPTLLARRQYGQPLQGGLRVVTAGTAILVTGVFPRPGVSGSQQRQNAGRPEEGTAGQVPPLDMAQLMADVEVDGI